MEGCPQMSELNYVELAYLKRAGVSLDDWPAELPIEVFRQLHSDIIPSQRALPTRDYDMGYFDETEQNPLTKQFMIALSFIYSSSEARGLNLTKPVDETFRKIADPKDANGNLWSERVQNFIDKLYPPAEYYTRMMTKTKDHSSRVNYLYPWLVLQFRGNSLLHLSSMPYAYPLLVEESNIPVLTILLSETAVAEELKVEWEKLAEEATKIAEGIIWYEQETWVIEEKPDTS